MKCGFALTFSSVAGAFIKIGYPSAENGFFVDIIILRVLTRHYMTRTFYTDAETETLG